MTTKQLITENRALKAQRDFLLGQYKFLCRELTKINHVVTIVWPTLREECNGHQLVEDYLDTLTGDE